MVLKANLIDIHQREIYPVSLRIENGRIESISRIDEDLDGYILPGFVDAHVHIESSMVTPVEFSRKALMHGTIAAVSDPHEIANVLGKEGVEFMLQNASYTPMKIVFGAPSCVPATQFESSGATITAKEVEELLNKEGIGYLSEMMNYPGVIFSDKEVLAKLSIAKNKGVPIDGHAPGVMGDDLKKYVAEGISTDHECFTLEEAEEKIGLGMKILIREGSGAKNFDALIPLLKKHPDMIMFCTDDLHPDDLIRGHINLMVKRAIDLGYDIYDAIKAGGYNAIQHYGINMGALKIGDAADFVLVDSLDDFKVCKTVIQGIEVYDGETVKVESQKVDAPNRFNIQPILPGDLKIQSIGSHIKVIEAINGELITRSKILPAKERGGEVVPDIENDVLKIAVINRYQKADPGLGFIKGFSLKKGAIASSIGHDSHNIICVGTSDREMEETINWIIMHKGGIAIHDRTTVNGLPLEIAGIISGGTVEDAAEKYYELTQNAKDMGTQLDAPFMTLAFMALLVIPELKLSDKGLFDGNTFSFTPLFVEEA